MDVGNVAYYFEKDIKGKSLFHSEKIDLRVNGIWILIKLEFTTLMKKHLNFNAEPKSWCYFCHCGVTVAIVPGIVLVISERRKQQSI